MLGRTLTALEQHHPESIFIVVGDRASQVDEYIRENFKHLPITLLMNQEFKTRNNFYSLALAADHIGSHYDQIILFNCDVIFDQSVLDQLIDQDRERSYTVVRLGACGEEEMKVTVNPERRIQNLSKEINPVAAHGEAVGIHAFSSSFWSRLKEYLTATKHIHPDKYYEHAIQYVLAEEPLYALGIANTPLMEVDFDEDLRRAESLFV